MDPKIFLALLAVIAVIVAVIPWRRRQKSGSKLSFEDSIERVKYSDGRPKPDLGAVDDIAAEISEPPVDGSVGGSD